MKPTPGDRVVAASVESVAESMQSSLQELGLSAVVSGEGEEVRVVSKTRKGKEFAFVLRRMATLDGEQTRVHLEWKNGVDGKSAVPLLRILADLELAKGQSRAGAK